MKVNASRSAEPDVGELVLDRYQAINLHWLLSCVAHSAPEDLPNLHTGDWTCEVLYALEQLMLQSTVEILPPNVVYPEGVPEFSEITEDVELRGFYVMICQGHADARPVDVQEFSSAEERSGFTRGFHRRKSPSEFILQVPEELNENYVTHTYKDKGLWERMAKYLEKKGLEHLLD